MATKSKVFVQSEWMATTNQKPVVREKSYKAKLTKEKPKKVGIYNRSGRDK